MLDCMFAGKGLRGLEGFKFGADSVFGKTVVWAQYTRKHSVCVLGCSAEAYQVSISVRGSLKVSHQTAQEC